jgi:hypothetical protein
MVRKSPAKSPVKKSTANVTLDQLVLHDDIITDVLVDNVGILSKYELRSALLTAKNRSITGLE